MESSQVLGGSSSKKCSESSESGWTMYIGSQIFNGKTDDRDEESDDSMASDASSGPIDLKLTARVSEQREADKKQCKQAKKVKRLSEKKMDCHEQTVPKAESCESQV